MWPPFCCGSHWLLVTINARSAYPRASQGLLLALADGGTSRLKKVQLEKVIKHCHSLDLGLTQSKYRVKVWGFCSAQAGFLPAPCEGRYIFGLYCCLAAQKGLREEILPFLGRESPQLQIGKQDLPHQQDHGFAMFSHGSEPNRPGRSLLHSLPEFKLLSTK